MGRWIRHPAAFGPARHGAFLMPGIEPGQKREPPGRGLFLFGRSRYSSLYRDCTALRATGREPREAGAGAPTCQPGHRRRRAGRWARNPAARRRIGGRRAGALPGSGRPRLPQLRHRKTPDEHGPQPWGNHAPDRGRTPNRTANHAAGAARKIKTTTRV